MTEVSWWQARALAGETMGDSSGEEVPLANASDGLWPATLWP